MSQKRDQPMSPSKANIKKPVSSYEPAAGSFYTDGGGPAAPEAQAPRTAYFGSPQKRIRSDSLGGPEKAAAMRKFGLETLEQMTRIQDLKDKFVGEKPLIWVDCDPGGDDCFALMWLFALEQKGHCKVLGISTADGNVSAPLTYAAADKVAHLCSSKVNICAQSPAYARFGTPEQRRAARIEEKKKNNGGGAAHIHGADGMGGLSVKLASSGKAYEDADEAYEQIIETLLHYPRQVVIVCIGPLSNLADACDQAPGILMLSRDIVIMGGAFTVQGNITPSAEFNFWKDAASAKKVIEEKGRKSITVIPLDVTTKLIVTKELVEQITQPEILKRQAQRLQLGPESDYPCCEVGKAMFLADLATFLIKSNMGFRCTKGHTGFLVHDASTLAFLFYPETISLTRGRVKVSTSEDVQGRTHLDMRHLPKAPGGSFVALDVDADAVLTVMVQDLMAAFNETNRQTQIDEFVVRRKPKKSIRSALFQDGASNAK